MESTAFQITFCIAIWQLLFSWATPLTSQNATLLREKRAYCRFECKSKQCLGLFQYECDGKVDCEDASDESMWACAAMSCPQFSFRCAYGGCVEKFMRCDQKKDCADGSDETGCEEQRSDSHCKLGEFRCGSGNCIRDVLKCDGVPHCSDKSDESEAVCADFPCLSFTFKCNYGACIDADRKCDGIPDCVDKSDESLESCGSTTRPTTSSTSHGVVTQTSSPSPVEGSSAFDVIQVCDPEVYHFEKPSVEVCRENKRSGGAPFILYGEDTTPEEVPWHAVIYHESQNKIRQICGGTLISLRLVITAAHCFWDKQERRFAKVQGYWVTLGKKYLNWTATNKYEQKFQISMVKANCFFAEKLKFFEYDIAAIILPRDALLTDGVQPVCIDWGLKYPEHVRQGLVAGMGLDSNYRQPEVLQKVWLPHVNSLECKKSYGVEDKYLSANKFCAGIKREKGVCNGDSGSGFLYHEDVWYLWGIVSTGLTNITYQHCSLQDYAVFTDVNRHLRWIRHVYT